MESESKLLPSQPLSSAAHPTRASPIRRRGGSAVSNVVATFLRVLLLPVICIGIPLWPLLGMLCAVPIIGIITIPLFILTTALLLYSVAWFSYLLLAQGDPPASSQHGHLAPYLPFLPFSPIRCLKINWAAFLYASTAISIAVPAVLDWSYRRVMVLGTQGGGGGIVRENISYGSPTPGKRLDVYLAPAPSAFGKGMDADPMSSPRQRKHSTHFAEPGSAPRTPEPGRNAKQTERNEGDGTRLAPVIVIVPSSIPPLMWTKNRKTYLQIALRLRRMGYCVVVPDLTMYPEGRVDASVIDLRLVLHWVAQNAQSYGGDERRIYLLGHGMSAHLAMLTLTQEAVVFSREGYLLNEDSVDREEDGQDIVRPQTPRLHGTARGDEEGERAHRESHTYHNTHASSNLAFGENGAPDESTWVDESGEEDVTPGASGMANTAQESRSSVSTGTVDAAQRSSSQRPGETLAAEQNSITFPVSSGGPRDGSGSSKKSSMTKGGDRSSVANLSADSISNGLRRVSIYGPEIEVPPVAGVILLAGIFDVIKCFRKESDRGVEHLSVLRRTCGPSHTLCLLHSPAHLLYAAKNVLDTSLLPSKFLLIHGGKDAVVDISQSTLLKTLLLGIGVSGVRLRAYRELGHVEAIASLFLGMGKLSTRYSKQILQDIGDFVAN